MTAKNTSAAAKTNEKDVKETEKSIPAQTTAEVIEDTNGKLSLIIGDKVPGTARVKAFVKKNKKTIVGVLAGAATIAIAAVVKSRMTLNELANVVEDEDEFGENSAA